MQAAFKRMVEQANVSSITETGTYHGESTLEFAKMVGHVITIESDEFNFQVAGQNLEMAIDCGLVTLCWADSAKVFREMVMLRGYRHGTDLFFLDAHYKEEWPLLDELQGINRIRAESEVKTTVVIDDFFVPDRPNFAGCYGGLRGDDSKGRESELIPCGYNDPFAAELDRFPFFQYPDYPEPSLGYCIASDFDFDLGPNFKRIR
jgi:hypothetical protein